MFGMLVVVKGCGFVTAMLKNPLHQSTDFKKMRQGQKAFTT